ncbi:MAG: DegT/DnrJ/EryC1/StrS family aminotransferase, partial [Pseudobdellovibrionaceae bacterium]
MMRKIPLLDLKKQYQSIKTDIDDAVLNVLASGNYIGGPVKEKFEKEFAATCGSRFCIGVGNGTDSLVVILRALGLSREDEIICPANGFIATPEAIGMAGGTPRFVDVDERTMNLNLDHVEEILSKNAASAGGKIQGIIPVHLYGRIVDMNRLMDIANKYQVFILEDAAQAHLAHIRGKKAGSFGIAGSFSFYPGKNLGAAGDAGAIISNNEDLYWKMRKIANHGRLTKYDHEMEGMNTRLDPIQAAVLSVKLRHLQQWTDQRVQVAKTYDRLLLNVLDVVRPEIPADGEHVFHLYVIRTRKRDQIHLNLKEMGIETIIHYPEMLPKTKAYQHLNLKLKDFPVSHM